MNIFSNSRFVIIDKNAEKENGWESKFFTFFNYEDAMWTKKNLWKAKSTEYGKKLPCFKCFFENIYLWQH
jgi:hypothetical protein